MINLIDNPVSSTWIFAAVLVIFLITTARMKKNPEWFPVSLTQELKGLAILGIIFAHVGYFLISDHRFLFPLSILAGVGVDLFLFLSGFGLATSALKRSLTRLEFYRKRLARLFIPFWIALAVFFLLDFLILKLHYPLTYIIQSFLGYFPGADLFRDLNSPLWYFTLILFYYLVFPWLFSKKFPWLSALIIYLLTYFTLSLRPSFLNGVFFLYQVHLIAFPLGIFCAWLFYEPLAFRRFLPERVRGLINRIERPARLKYLIDKFRRSNIPDRLKKNLSRPAYYLLIIALIFIAGYFAYNSGVGQAPITEELISLVTMSAIVLLFILKRLDLRLLHLFGVRTLHCP